MVRVRPLALPAAAVTLLASLGCMCSGLVAPACPERYGSLTEAEKAANYQCKCDGAGSGSVWGSGIYTTDSSVCAAAVHAGAIASTGGAVTVKPAAGCSQYPGVTANGVTSSSWGSFPNSFYFDGKGDGTCPAVPATACPSSYSAIPNVATLEASYACMCQAQDTQTGTVWGTGIYTLDSSLCRAALQVGAVPATGGVITINPAAGCPTYTGSDMNGVQSNGWGSYARSFYLAGYGTGVCPTG